MGASRDLEVGGALCPTFSSPHRGPVESPSHPEGGASRRSPQHDPVVVPFGAADTERAFEEAHKALHVVRSGRMPYHRQVGQGGVAEFELEAVVPVGAATASARRAESNSS